MVGVVQLAIALGSTIGGLLFDASGYQSTFAASAIVLLLACSPQLFDHASDIQEYS